MSDHSLKLEVIFLGKAASYSSSEGTGLTCDWIPLRVFFSRSAGKSMMTADDQGDPVNIILPVRYRQDLDEYFKYNRSLPFGLNVNNSPVELVEQLPDDLAADTRILILTADDWESIALLPSFLDDLKRRYTRPEIHIICRSETGADTLPEDRYLAGAKIYGGLREISLIAASHHEKHMVDWFFWDICPIFDEYNRPLQPCLNFIDLRERIGRQRSFFTCPDKGLQSGDTLYPPVCRAAGVNYVHWEAGAIRKSIRAGALQQLAGIIDEKGRALNGSKTTGWTQLQWIRRPTFYEEREDLERYLENHVWQPLSWNSFWEDTLREAAVAIEKRLVALLPEVRPVPESETFKDAEKIKDKLNAWLAEDLQAAASRCAGVLEEVGGVEKSSYLWLRNSNLFALGLGWADSNVLCEFIQNKKEEIDERLRLSKREKRNVEQSLATLMGKMKAFSSLPVGIEKLRLKERRSMLADFNRKRLEALAEMLADVKAAVLETAWNGVLLNARRCLDLLAGKIPAFYESQLLMTKVRNDGLPARHLHDDILALLALQKTGPCHDWKEFWTNIWNGYLDADELDAASVIHRAILPLELPPPETLKELEMVAGVASQWKLTASQTAVLLKSLDAEAEPVSDTAKDLIQIVEAQRQADAAWFAKDVVRKSSVYCRFYQAEPRLRLLASGNINQWELEAIKNEPVYFDVLDMPPVSDELKMSVLSETEPFGFNRLRVFHDSAKDWELMLERANHEAFEDAGGFCFWVPGAAREGEDFSRLGLHILTLIARIVESCEAGILDWDDSGHVKNGQIKEVTLVDWLAQNWNSASGFCRKDADSGKNQKLLITKERLLKIGQAKLAAIPGIADGYPFLSMILGRCRGNPVQGILEMQEKFTTPVRTDGLWKFKLRA